MPTTKPDTERGWTKEFPATSGIYWARWPSSVTVNTFIVEVIGKRFYMTGRSLICPNHETPYPAEWRGPISPSDFEQLTRLRAVAATVLKYLDQQSGRDYPFNKEPQSLARALSVALAQRTGEKS